MERFGIKATLYDLFGYVLPGALSVAIVARAWVIIFSSQECGNILRMAGKMNPYTLMGLLGLSYVMGHFVSALSSRIIEKGLCKWSDKLASQTRLTTVLQPLYGKLEDSYRKHFETDLDDRSMGIITTVVEEEMPRAYSTAFVFLSIYGMARSLSLVFLFGAIVEVILACAGKGYFLIAIGLVAPVAVFFLHYIKFRRHFIAQVCNAYLVNRCE